MWTRYVTLLALGIGLSSAGWVMAQATTQPEPVKTIFDYKSELSLSDDQERRMRQILLDLNKEVQVERAKLTILGYDLEELIRKEADLDQIRRALQQEAELRANIAYADLAAGRQINGTLSSEQLGRWRQIQASARQAVAQAAPDANQPIHTEPSALDKHEKKDSTTAKLKKK